MISKILIYVKDTNFLEEYRKVGISAFLFALEDYSVGYETYSLEEIEKIDVNNKYILINRMLNCNDIDKLKAILPNIKTIKGIIYEDIGVYELVKSLNIDVELIYYQNHFGTNSSQINYWLNKVDSMFISNEITIEEVKEILAKTNKPLCVNLYGHNQVMYSRRLLLSNWSENFNIQYKNTNKITDIATKVGFIAHENEYGTVMYSEKIFNGKELLELPNIKFYYINTMFIEEKDIIEYLKDILRPLNNNEDNGFLERKTIYKLKGDK